MLPNIWIFDTYSILMVLGVIMCFILLNIFFKKYNLNKKYYYDVCILACFSILFGILFAILFQIIFDAFEGHIRGTAMTFYGGLVGGVVSFVIGYNFILKRKYNDISFIQDILPIAPACITIAHSFGRLGCFCAGCCYGAETTSWLGVKFQTSATTVYPTQLFEALFLLLLTILLFILAIKKRNYFNMSIYLLMYGVFRFLLEFIRGDDRGGFILFLSPSQWFSIIAIISSIVLFYVLKKKYIVKEIRG